MEDEEPEPSVHNPIQSQLSLPTNEEVYDFVLSTLRHSNHFHYFGRMLNIGAEDPELPHDLVGVGNKYEWNIIKGLALMFREPPVDFQEYIHPSRELHRKQYHHVKGNGDKPNPHATDADMKVWALDTACTLLENRPYEIPVHSYDELEERFEKFPEHKRKYGPILVPAMRRIEKPKLELITNPLDFPNIGVFEDIYEKMKTRTQEVVSMLRQMGYRFDGIFRYAEVHS